MNVRTIRVYPDPVLRKKSKEVDEVSKSIEDLARDMVATLRWSNGVGLAAPQIGELVRIAVLDLSVEDTSKEPLCIINPEIIEQEGSTVAEEGCLSIPGTYELLERPSTVSVRGLNLAGESLEMEFTGILARAISHEIDHLDGILYIDRLSPVRRALLKSRLKKLRADASS